jgi:hypothetical protein
MKLHRTFLVGVFCLLTGSLACAQQTNNYVLRAVPAPKTVPLTGQLTHWDTSGKILICYDIKKLLPTHSVYAMAMYDRRYLYLAFVFRDPTPMINHIDPRIEPQNGWRSDAVQVRIKTDRILHITAWYYTDRKEPCMIIHYGMWNRSDPDYADLNDALAVGAKETFLKAADGKGYTQEMAIPWKLITRDGHPLKAGDTMRMGIEVFWGGPDGYTWPEHRYADLINPNDPQREFFWENPDAWGTVEFLGHGHLTPSPSVEQLSLVQKEFQLEYSTAGPVPIHYKLPYNAHVTLVIEKPDGTRVRNLISDYPRHAGANTDYWDGTDDNGHLVPPGTYIVRGLYHKPLDVLYEFAYGNPGNPEYLNSSGTGGWLSNEDDPFAVATDDQHIYVAANQAEGATAVLAINDSGQRVWGHGGISGGVMTRYGNYLYMVVGGSTYHPGVPDGEVDIERLDPNNGQFVPFPDGKGAHKIASIAVDPSQWPGFKPRPPEGVAVATHQFDATWCQRQPMGLAADQNNLYASLYYQNQIVVINPQTGDPIGQIPVPHPTGLATDRTGTLYAVSEKQVVRVNPHTGTLTPVITSNLDAPIGLAVDAQGNFYVSDWGAAMDVKVFSPNGTYLRTIGIPGGRPLNGSYNPNGFFRPWGVAIDHQNRLWVVEFDHTPRRVSVWDTQSGRLIHEYCGTTHYASDGAQINAANPREAFVLGNTCELDWQKGLWRVTGTLFRRTQPDALFTLGPQENFHSIQEVHLHNEDLLVFTGHFFYCVAKREKYGVRPLTAFGDVYSLYHNEAWPDLILRNLAPPNLLAQLEEQYPKAFNGLGAPYPDVALMLQASNNIKRYFLWIDSHGDGLVHPSDIHFYSKEELHGFDPGFGINEWEYAVAPNTLTVYLPSSSQEKGLPYLDVYKLQVVNWNDVGAPVYDFGKAVLIAHLPVNGYYDSFAWADAKGSILLGINPLTMLSATGKLLWTYPNPWPGVHGSHEAPGAKNGRIIGPLYVLGAASLPNIGEFFAMNGNLGERYLMTADGLYIGSLFQDCRSAPDTLPDTPERGMSINGCTAGGEPFGGSFFQNPLDGKFYIEGPVDSGRECSIVGKVVGLNSVRRIPDITLIFTVHQHQLAQKFLTQQAAQAAAAKTLYIASIPKPVFGLPNWDDFAWNDDRRVASWSFDAHHSAQATWTYDSKNLYLAFQVVDDTPMINNGDDIYRLFKTGDAIEFELRTRANDTTKGVIVGDLRLLLSVYHGKPVAVLYRYKALGAPHPMGFTSPLGTTHVDSVAVLPDAQVAVERYTGGYRLRAAIPLTDLGFSPQPGNTYLGDMGIVYSDPTGTIDTLRMYWANPVNAMVNDLSTEAQITPAAWGRFVVEK